MFKYTIFRTTDGKELGHLEVVEDVENPFPDRFMQRNKLHEEYIKEDEETGEDVVVPKNYNIVREDITSKIAQEEARELARRQAKNRLGQVRALLNEAKSASSAAEIKAVIVKQSKAIIQIAKQLGAVDPGEPEE